MKGIFDASLSSSSSLSYTVLPRRRWQIKLLLAILHPINHFPVFITTSMKQIKLVSLAILLFASAAFAQNKMLSIDDIFSLDSKVRVNFSGTPGRFAWTADGKSFRSVRSGNLVRVDPVNGNATPYLDSTKFKTALEQSGMSSEDATRM